MQGNDTFRLVVRRGPQPNQAHTLNDEVISLGRDITNNIVINDREVSRHHLRLMRGAEGYSIEDLGSTNGTFVNGKRISGVTALKNGDMVGLGETVTLGYEVVRASQQQPSTPPPVTPPPDTYQAPAPSPAPSQSPADYDAYRPPTPPPQQQAPSYDPYQPPAQQQPPQAPPYQQQPPADSYAPPGDYDAQGGYYPAQNYAPPPPGYDYDPYAMREEGGSSTMRFVLFGCLGLMIFCCLVTVVGVVLVDTLNLYCDLPGIRNVLQALGLLRC